MGLARKITQFLFMCFSVSCIINLCTSFIYEERNKFMCAYRVHVHLGFFMEPTIFTNVEDHMFIAKEESFGPVMVISIFENGWELIPKTRRLYMSLHLHAYM